ncbi:MAG: Fic family protein, partial [Pseudobdellovibrio sp.]
MMFNYSRYLLITSVIISTQAATASKLTCEDMFRGANVFISNFDELSDYGKSKIDPLYELRQKQQNNQSSILKGNEETVEMLRMFSDRIDPYLENRNYELDMQPHQMLRLIGYDSYKKFKEQFPERTASALYGVETMNSWKMADDYLASIPVGQLKLTPELFKKVNSFSGEVLKPLPVNIPFKISGITPDTKGSFKLLPNSGRHPLYEPLKEHEYQNLKANPWIAGFFELPYPFSKPNARKGVIVYAWPHTVEKKLAKLIEWYEANKDTMDPIKLATQFQRNFISIHPFVDGNGRTSRLIMDRILLEHGLPPSLILDHNMDLYSKMEDYEKMVRQGVADMINLIRESYDYNQLPEVQASNLHQLAHERNKTPIEKKILQDFINLKSFKFTVGDRKFSFNPDGFLYDQFGVAHAYHNGAFYPLADRMIELYDFGGDMKYTTDGYSVFDRVGRRTVHSHTTAARALSLAKINIIKDNLRIMDKIKKRQIRYEGLKTISYSEIQKANK